MPPKKRCSAPVAEPMVSAAEPDDCPPAAAKHGRAEMYEVHEMLSLKELVETPLPIVVVPNDVHYEWKAGFQALFTTGPALRGAIDAWLTGAYPEYDGLDLCGLVLKCGYFTSLEALAQPWIMMPEQKWSRVVDLLCVLHAVRADLGEFCGEIQEFFDDKMIESKAESKTLLDRDLKELTVYQVAQVLRYYAEDLIGALDDASSPAAGKLCFDLCKSYSRLSASPQLCLRQLVSLGEAANDKLGDAGFLEMICESDADPEWDQRVRRRQVYSPTSPVYSPSVPAYCPSSPAPRPLRAPCSPSYEPSSPVY